MNNLYWTIYKNLEEEVLSLSKAIHIDDTQLSVYSVKNCELILRMAVEVEALAKELYFINGGTKPDDIELFFDTDCIELLETKWKLSKKVVLVSSPFMNFESEQNQKLTPLKKANKRGTSSADWLKAYQAIKHNRSRNLKKGNIKHVIRGLAGLYLLNIYYKNTIYDLGRDSTGSTFDSRLSSDIFSVLVHSFKSFSIDKEYVIGQDYDQCSYLIVPEKDSIKSFQDVLKKVNTESKELTNSNLAEKLQSKLNTSIKSGKKVDSVELKAEAKKVALENKKSILKAKRSELQTIASKLSYKSILNTNQYEETNS